MFFVCLIFTILFYATEQTGAATQLNNDPPLFGKEIGNFPPSPFGSHSFGIPGFDVEKQTENKDEFINVKVISSRDGVYINVNSKEVLKLYDENNLETKDFRNASNGLHLVILNSKTGDVIAKKLFMTELFAESIGIHPVFSAFSSGEIFILAVKFDAGLNLSKDIRLLFKEMGSTIVYATVYRCYFVWVFSKGGRIFLEGMVNDNAGESGDFVTSPIRAEVSIPRSTAETCWDLKQDGGKTREGRRATFCSIYGGFGQLCDCEAPTDINFPPKELAGSVIRDVPVLIIASNRPQALYRSIATLLAQPGGRRSHIFVVTDGYHKQVTELLEMLEISHVVNSMDRIKFKGHGGRICAQYKFALDSTLKRFPTAEYVIVLEEDVLTAPDFLSFFNQTAKLLSMDPSLYCINAWNDLSAMHTGGNPHRVHRVETQPSYGWMVTSKFFREVNAYWVPHDNDYDWDIWFRGPWVRASRECLVPEISRSFHMGESGVHIKGQMTYSQFVGHLTTAKEQIILEDLDTLTEEKYEEEIYSLLESDKVVYLNTSLHPCNSHFVPRNYTEKIVVLFFMMDSGQDTQAWMRLASCMGLLNMDTRNNHRGLFRFYFYNTHIFAIGVPYSDYSFVMPNFVVPISSLKSKWDEENMGKYTLQNRKRFRVPHLEKRLPHPLLLEEPQAKPSYIRKYITEEMMNAQSQKEEAF